jgi:hypothetical protein
LVNVMKTSESFNSKNDIKQTSFHIWIYSSIFHPKKPCLHQELVRSFS